MKKIYLLFALFCIFSSFIFPKTTFAQCSCAAGTTPNSVTYLQTLKLTNAASSTISFPQFDPSLGTLTCVKFEDTISGVTTSVIQNSGSTTTIFSFLLTVANGMTGPGVSLTETFTKNLGPNSLDAGGQITYGPDSLFKNVPDSSYANDTTGYQGKGKINFTYSLNGGMVALGGGLNYNSQIITNYLGNFRLTYYYCNSNTVTSQSPCSQFTATKQNGNVNLNWDCNSSLANHVNCEITSSKNGYQYYPVGNCNSPSQSSGTTASYHYTYNCSSGENSKIYFQIKLTDPAGDVNYCPTRWVDLSKSGIGGCNVYPNPARNSAVAEFDEMLTGNYTLELVNGTGICVQRKQVSLTNSNQMNVDVSGLKKGLYYMHLKDNSTSQQIVCKILVQ